MARRKKKLYDVPTPVTINDQYNNAIVKLLEEISEALKILSEGVVDKNENIRKKGNGTKPTPKKNIAVSKTGTDK